MSSRLDQEREAKLQPERIRHSVAELEKLGMADIKINDTTITFTFNDATIWLFPYSGWHQGK